jgi:hypothetical protein
MSRMYMERVHLLGRMFGATRDGIIGNYRNPHNEELYNLIPS